MISFNKQRLLDVAEVIDAYRLFPRVMMHGYAALIYVCTYWYMHLPPEGRTTDVTAFIGTVYGIAGVVTGLYLRGGRNWTGKDNADNTN